jgi:hypothetical protein
MKNSHSGSFILLIHICRNKSAPVVSCFINCNLMFCFVFFHKSDCAGYLFRYLSQTNTKIKSGIPGLQSGDARYPIDLPTTSVSLCSHSLGRFRGPYSTRHFAHSSCPAYLDLLAFCIPSPPDYMRVISGTSRGALALFSLHMSPGLGFMVKDLGFNPKP